MNNNYLRQLGARILSEANDLKRTPEALAEELGLEPRLLKDVIAGQAERSTAEDILLRMAHHYPISLADIWIEEDDTDHGVVIAREEDSRRSARIFERKDKTGGLTPYYEYRDTAMSAIAPYKPEWIKELRVVEDSDPDNPDVAYNTGHLMHQLTFFIGEVNFYWKSNGKSYCAEMNTGDSNYLTPFVPHSFTSRNPDQPGLIIAITYGGSVRRALGEVSAYGLDALNELSGDSRNLASAFASRIAFLRDAESLSIDQLAERLADRGIERQRAIELAEGKLTPTEPEKLSMAGSLGVRINDILVHQLDTANEVVVKKSADAEPRNVMEDNSASYYLTELARPKHQPLLKAFELTVPESQSKAALFRQGLHEYVYNYRRTAVVIKWGENRSETLNPGDSAYVQPMISHGFEQIEGEAHLVIVRVPGSVQGSVLDEFSSYPADGRQRVIEEYKRWF